MLIKKDKKKIIQYHKNWVKDGGKITEYNCNHCKKSIPTNQPRKNQVGSRGYWDSLMTCLECGKLNFVLVYPSGKTISKKFPSKK